MIIFFLTIYLSIGISFQSKSSDDYPIDWHKAASSINDYPLVFNCSSSLYRSSKKGNCRWIDPWNYIDRLGLYKILIKATSPLMPFSLVNNASNILFGLPSQFSWQYKSNRLFSNQTKLVSTDSWWASANYYLSVIPFLGAVQAGLLGKTQFQLNRKESFCSNVEQCFNQVPQAMNLWKEFFQMISQKHYCNSTVINDRLIDQCYLKPMWLAHVASVKDALPLISSKVALLPSKKEQQFALTWAYLVDFIGESRKNTNLTETDLYQEEFLPERMLNDQDDPPNIPDLPYSVNKALELLLSINEQWYPDLEDLWKPATCNFDARIDAQRVLETMALSKLLAIKYYSEAIIKSKIYPCDQDEID